MTLSIKKKKKGHTYKDFKRLNYEIEFQDNRFIDRKNISATFRLSNKLLKLYSKAVQHLLVLPVLWASCAFSETYMYLNFIDQIDSKIERKVCTMCFPEIRLCGVLLKYRFVDRGQSAARYWWKILDLTKIFWFIFYILWRI